MVALTQYPHYLYKVEQATAYQDEYGNWQKGGSESLVSVGMCRYEVNGQGAQYDTADGRHVVITGIIYMMPTDFAMIDGDSLVVYRDSEKTEVLYKCQVVNVDYGRLHTRIWTV